MSSTEADTGPNDDRKQRQPARSSAESLLSAASATSNSQDEAAVASTQIAPTNAASSSNQPLLPAPTDEHDFISPPYFSRSNPLHQSLFKFDASYRCTICGDLFINPVAVVSCLHTFCSECIRKHCKFNMAGMKRECKCPECNRLIAKSGQSYESKILANHNFANQVTIYKQMREGLRTALAKLDVLEKNSNGRNSDLVNGVNVDVDDVGTEGKRKCESEETNGNTPKRACRKAAKKTKYTDGSSDSENENDSDFEVIQPPIESKPKVTLHPKTLVSYHGMKHKKLVELCKNEGLPSNGNDEELKKRHSEFITLYNSECDAEHPRSVAELVKEIKKRESGRKKEASMAIQNGSSRHDTYMKRLGQNVKIRGEGGTASLTSGDKNFDDAMKNKFRELIQKGKARMGKENNTSTNADEPCEMESDEQTPVNPIRDSAKSPDSSDTEPYAQSSPEVELPLHQPRVQAKQPSSTPKQPRQRNRKSPPQPSSSRIISTGPWKCSICTYINERNTTSKARCEMCNAIRSEKVSKRQDVEVVNIDC